MKRAPTALGIRTKLLLTLSVFLAIPWLGYQYVNELERFLREAQERTLAGTAQAVATALHDRPRLFESRGQALAPGGREPDDMVDAAAARGAAQGGSAPSPELEEILRGLTRTTARISVVDRDLDVLARAGTLKRPAAPEPPAAGPVASVRRLEHALMRPIYARLLDQPTEEFAEETVGRTFPSGSIVQGALDGAPSVGRRLTLDEKATVVVAAHPIWVGQRVHGAVVVEETTNSVLAERNRAFERLFTIVLGVLLAGTLALAIFASRLSGRIRRLRDEVDQAIDAHGRVRHIAAGSRAGDEIGDLSRSFSDVLQRLGENAAHREQLASRLSHELRTPVAVVKSSLENLRAHPVPADANVYLERAQGGLDRLSQILTRMSEATRLEQSLHEVERERCDVAALVSACVDGYRGAYPHAVFAVTAPEPVMIDGAPDLIAQMLDKLVANAIEFATPGTPVAVTVERAGAFARIAVANQGAPLPEGMRERLFESMVSARSATQGNGTPHLGLGLYIVRLIAEFHGGHAQASDLPGRRGVVVAVSLPLPMSP
jgi:dedicated sortase system histidine kinase